MDDGQVEDHRMRVAGLGTGLRIVLGAKVEAMEQLGFMDGHLDGHLVDTWWTGRGLSSTGALSWEPLGSWLG